MSDEQTNGSEASVRRAFRAKLSPGPSEEVIVLAADAVRAVELLGEKFDWKNIELSRIDEAQLIADATKDEEKYIQECNQLRNNNVVRGKKIEELNATLLLCQRAAVGEQTQFGKGDLANSNALRAIVERVDQYGEVNRSTIELKRTLNQADCEIDKLRKEGKGLTEERDCLKEDLKEIGQVAVELRQKIETFNTTKFKPAPSGPVPTGPPASVAEQNQLGRLEEKYKRQCQNAFQLVQQRNFLYDLLENFCRAALGKPIKEIVPDEPWDDQDKLTEVKAALDAVIGLRGRFEAVGHVEKKLTLEEMTKIALEMPDGLYEWKNGVPTPVPAVPAYHPPLIPPISPGDKIFGPAQIGPGPNDYGTGGAEMMTGPGKPAKVTGTGDAEKGDENNYMAPEMRQAGFGRLTDPDFARAPESEEDEAPRYGELKWEFWRADTPMEDRTFFIARHIDGGTRAYVYWPMEEVLQMSPWDFITQNCHKVTCEVSERDLQVLNQKMEEKGYKP